MLYNSYWARNKNNNNIENTQINKIYKYKLANKLI